MSRKIIPFFILLSLFFSACNTQPYLREHSAFIVFKTAAFKYADLGFIYENSKEVKAEIYSSGQPVMSLTVSDSAVCLSLLACMPQRDFNRKVLSVHYPDGILNDILRGKPIFQNLNLRRSSNGFTQTIIKQNKYNIHYSVLNDEIIFRDTINHILIKVKKQ